MVDIVLNFQRGCDMAKEKKNEVVRLRISADDKAKLKEYAEKRGLTISDLLREIIGGLIKDGK